MEHRKNIFITGATSGIGLALAEAYLKDGHHVALCGRDVSKIPNNFKDIYPLMHIYEADVTDKEKIQSAIVKFCKGDIDILIANAGVKGDSNLDFIDFDSSRKIIDINVVGLLNTLEIGVQLMVPRRKGQLVAIASVAGLIGIPGAAAYCASKAAVLKFMESLSIDMASYGVATTTIAPGFIDTPMTRGNNHSMPFLMDARTGALKIKNAITKRKRLYLFPFRMKVLIYILEKMPRSLYFFLMRAFKVRS